MADDRLSENRGGDFPGDVPRTTGKFLLFLLERIWRKRKFWLLPLWILLVTLGLLLALSGGSTVLPAIYLAI